MKILALGGAGQEGARSVADLAAAEAVTSVVVGDLNIAAAEALKDKLGSDKISCLQIDATDHEALVATLRGVDVVLTFVGPYFRFGVPILKAAIAAGTNYVDICDDTEPTLEMLDLCAQAEAAGITAVIGAGVSPGLINVNIRDASTKLDRMDEVHLRWNVPVTDIEGDISQSAALEHGLHMINGEVLQFIDGAHVRVPAMSGSETVRYAALGDREAYFLGHPEPVTVPRYFPELKTVTQKGGVAGLDDVLRSMRELGLTSETPINVKKQLVRPSEMGMALLGLMPDPTEEERKYLPPPVSEFITFVIGERGGKKIKLSYGVAGPMGPLTGTPASIVTQMIGAGQITKRGVFAPEGVVDSTIFLTELAKRGIMVSFAEEILPE
jgi:saccharopine dehydrogenase-like NADP-dependent oxidoreductase